jgi:hypothetical protein
MDYPWYEKLENVESVNLIQGELILNCPIITPPANCKVGTQPDVKVTTFNVFVMSQSCDIENSNVEIVLVCPFYNWSEVIKTIDTTWQNKKGYEKFWNNLKKGAEPAYHLIKNDSSVNIKEPIIVDFTNVFGIHVSALKEHIKTFDYRIRLLSPYREHLSQAFARYFMRVGLPQSIPSYSQQFPAK